MRLLKNKNNIGGLKVDVTTYHQFEFALHTHEYHELLVILSGTGVHLVNGVEYHAIAGDVFVMRTGDSHAWHNTQHMRFLNLIYTEENLKALGAPVRTLEGFQRLFVIDVALRNAERPYSAMFHLSGAALAQIEPLIEALSHEYAAKLPASETMLSAYFQQIIVQLCRFHDQEAPAMPHPDLPLAMAVSHLEAHFDEDLRLEDLADIAHLSVNHFVHQFGRIFGLPPMRYLKELRVQRACTLLRTTSMSVTEVAAAVGLVDSNYFSRVFTSVMGLSPTKFRRG